ncbi:UDP-glucose dehydrogenase family protein [Thermodesulforhabdus norvegica]|uniref:UDP-glucose 6-dehydrogenase n=1 Tax=Thermodesulforhabdus norvegica TaxID=39841 RepID=A0A1I4V1I5_9BACT|nr:UDP-glucose/GDP-mannose dehydrogenase family protein [Thermodesulforhabdus norvegica]SFM95046.1 UDP-glucose dehydrogenase [Thermodesulforhabdus norvegica]
MNVAIIGTGYVGLVSGAGFAEFGHRVVCVDKDESKIMCVHNGDLPIYEPGLEEIVKRNRQAGRLQFTTSLEEAIPGSQVVFIAVGTPESRRGDGYADLTYVYEAAREIASFLGNYTVIVVKSTVPVGTARQVARIVREVNPGAEFDVASNPEFLREGDAVFDFLNPDRVVIGVESEKARRILLDLYRPLQKKEIPILVTGVETAELIKYASNAFLATKISFINEIANLCEEVGADVQDVARGMGLDQRIGLKFLQPGPGYGGSCFPKDTKALLRIAQESGVACRIVEAVVEVNAAQRARMVRKIRQALGGSEAGKVVAVLGLTFKPDTDDMREAPSLTIIPALVERGALVRAHDPQGMKEARRLLPSEVLFCDDPYEACSEADAVVLMTEWNEYKNIDLSRLKRLVRKPVFVDLRNVFSPGDMEKAGFDYFSVGRKPVYGFSSPACS